MQHPERIYLVICILGVILVGSNALMYAIVRGSRGTNFNWFKDFGKNVRQPWAREDEGLKELAKEAEKIRSEQNQKEE